MTGCYIGTNGAGTAAVPNGNFGIYVGVLGSTIGGTASGSGNLVSGNAIGIDIQAPCIVVGNEIGTNEAGTVAVPNTSYGIYVAVSGATIGGTTTGSGNLISGNNSDGIDLAASCLVEGNKIGANQAGTAAVPNTAFGIYVGASGATIGATTTGSGNLIFGNSGGGIDNLYGNVTSLSNDTISGNSGSTGGGITNYGTLTVTDCTISGNSASYAGGGMWSVGTATVTDSTFSRNSAASYGGGIFIANTVTVTDCTVTGNSTSGSGGGILNDGDTATVTDCTVTGNSASAGGGIEAEPSYIGGTSTVVGTIVAGNTGGDITGSYSGNHDLVGGNPLLAPLGNYGGPTQTMPPLPGSPAIGAGTAVSGVTTDQRGAVRGFTIDIGADQVSTVVESGSAPSTRHRPARR